ncbi:MAG: hypothetical protein GXY07_00505 [Candidatus Hydrogenedentes bacterium]|mgnify:FL=1|nr:hypothetical protein [Candidatus Hydrogenedentota bacterium]
MKRVFYCHKCAGHWENDTARPGFKEICTHCGAYLHCCKNCRFHLPTAHNQCYIPDTEYVADRKGLNFCEEFEFRSGTPEQDGQKGQREQASEKFAGLFGELPDPPAKTSFDDLFRD